MRSDDRDSREPAPSWKVRQRPLSGWRRLAGHVAAQAEAVAPDGTTFLVQIRRSGLLKGLSLRSGLPTDVTALAALVGENVREFGTAGWSIDVVTPATAFRAERRRLRQHVAAPALIADIALAVVDAITRGDLLWDDA